MQPQLSLMHQFLHKVSHEEHPGQHQHEWEDKRDGLQVPGGIQRCELSVKFQENIQSLSAAADKEAYHAVTRLTRRGCGF